VAAVARVLAIFLAAGMTLALAAPAAAKRIVGTARSDRLVGTNAADVIYGKAGNDRIFGRGGSDRIYGGAGRDTIFCGRGRDVVFADRSDRVASDCEVMHRPTVTPPPPAPPPPPPPPKLGSRSNPVPIGGYIITFDSFRVSVQSTIPDATSIVTADPYGNRPPSGYQFFMALIQVTNVGTGVRSFGFHRLGVAAASNNVYKSDDYPTCYYGGYASGPNPLLNKDLPPNASTSGYECWGVRTTDANSLEMYDTEDPSTLWWSLHP
jgi:Ca2+-binding RTX toxin-like protein